MTRACGILAASKSNEEAMEPGGNIKQGLLSHALVEEGLVEGKAAKDGKILMSDCWSMASTRSRIFMRPGRSKDPRKNNR